MVVQFLFWQTFCKSEMKEPNCALSESRFSSSCLSRNYDTWNFFGGIIIFYAWRCLSAKKDFDTKNEQHHKIFILCYFEQECYFINKWNETVKSTNVYIWVKLLQFRTVV